MKMIFCEKCNKKVAYDVRKSVIEDFKGHKVNIEENIAVCNECGTELFVPEIENDNLKRLYAKYATLAGIITPDEIINFREKYKVSQRELVAILGWGKMTINRYENGGLPSKSHSDILKDISISEESFKERAYEAYKTSRISEKKYIKLMNSFKSTSENMIMSLLENEFSHKESIENGFRKFDVERVENLISYIASKVDNLYKTSLNKYLWFIDLLNYKENTRSITGFVYVKQQFGPTIEKKGYEMIINLLDNKFDIEETEEDYNSTKKIISKNNYDMSMFSEDEMEVINLVINNFKGKTCTNISNELHKEPGWLENNINNVISYEYGDRLVYDFK